jgi:RNase P subunit RPR2
MINSMFAPYCSTCGSRVLLGYDDIVRFTSDGAADHVVVLRCSCGELLEWDQQPPEAGVPAWR